MQTKSEAAVTKNIIFVPFRDETAFVFKAFVSNKTTSSAWSSMISEPRGRRFISYDCAKPMTTLRALSTLHLSVKRITPPSFKCAFKNGFPPS